MLRVAGTHTHTNAQRQRQDIGTPTHLLRLLSRAPLHFAPIQFSSLHLSRSGELASGITRIHKRRQAVDAARSAWPQKNPSKPLETPAFWTDCRCARLAVSLSVKSQTRHSRRQRYGQGHAAAATSQPHPLFALEKSTPPPMHTLALPWQTFDKSINQFAFLFCFPAFALFALRWAMCYFYYYIYFLFFYNLNLSFRSTANAIHFVCPGRLFVFVILAVYALRFLHFCANPAAFASVAYFRGLVAGCVYDRTVWTKFATAQSWRKVGPSRI